MELVETPLSSLCNSFTESAIHFFSECHLTQTLGNKLQHWLYSNIELLPQTPPLPLSSLTLRWPGGGGGGGGEGVATISKGISCFSPEWRELLFHTNF